MNVAALLRQRVARLLVVCAALLLIVFQLSSLSAFLSASTSAEQLSAEHSRIVSELRTDAATFSPHHSITWLLAVMHELADEVELNNVRGSLVALRAAGVADERVVVMERRARSGQSSQTVSLSSALGVRVLSLKRGSASSSVAQYVEMLSAAFSSSTSADRTPTSALIALIPSHIRLAADLPAYFFHVARLLKVDSTLLAASASSPFSALSLSSSWLPADVDRHSNVAAFILSANVDSQLTSSLADIDTALLLTAASFASVAASLRSPSSSASLSLPAALSSLSAGRSFVSPVVSRAVSLLPSPAGRTSERLSAVDGTQAAVTWLELSRLSSVGYGHFLATLLPTCALLVGPDDVMDRRSECVVLVAPASTSSDVEWHLLLSKWLGAYSMPPVERQLAAVGEWRGVVVLRYMTNIVLLVAPYSPFFSFLPSPSTARGLSLVVEHVGCYRHPAASQSDLPHIMHFLSARSLTPARCLDACVHRGFQFAGVEHGRVCRCGTGFTRSLKLNTTDCSTRCSPSISLPTGPQMSDSGSSACGGSSAVSLYTDIGASHTRYQRESTAASFVRAREGESCTAACQRSGAAGECREELFALLTCGSMRSVGYRAGQCVEAAQLTDEDTARSLHVVAAPYVRTGSDGVILGAARWHDCRAVPLPETGRACVCAV